MKSLDGLVALIDELVENDTDRNKKVEVLAFRRLQQHLKRIPSILYFNPIFVSKYIGEIKPDILWFYPKMGLLIIEVKAWDKDFIENLSISTDDKFWYGNERSYPNPIKEANRFKEKLMNYIKSKLNKLPVPIEYVVYFPNLTRKEFKNLKNERFKNLIFEDCCVFKQDLNIEKRLVERLSNFHMQVKEEEILKLRRILFPQLLISHFDSRLNRWEVPLMDVYQEKLLYRYSRGYRILRGTAGSGKTVVLIGKALQEKAKDKNKKVLIVTFANSLVNEIKSNLENLLEVAEIEGLSLNDFEIKTLDSLIYDLAHKYLDSKSRGTSVYKEFLGLLKDNPDLISEEEKYDVILCDESQDFSKDVFPVIKALAKENGLIIFGVDETQRIYDGTDWKWVDVGFNASGKVTILRKSYRNPGKIFKLAFEFLKKDPKLMEELKELQAVVTEDGIESIRKDDGEVEFYETDNEFEIVPEIVQKLLREGVNPGDIFILTSFSGLAEKFYKSLSKEIPELGNKVHYFSSDSSKELKFIPKNELVIMPYKSAKGLERPVVIVTGINNLPYMSSTKIADKRRDRRTLYVALTRAQEKLIITSYLKKDSEFAKDIKEIVKELTQTNENSTSLKKL